MNHELPYVQHVQRELLHMTEAGKERVLQVASFRDFLLAHPPEDTNLSGYFQINLEFKIFTKGEVGSAHHPCSLVEAAADSFFASHVAGVKKELSFVPSQEPLSRFDDVIREDFRNCMEYSLHQARLQAIAVVHYSTPDLPQARSFAFLCGEDITAREEEIAQLFVASAIREDRAYIADAIERITKYKEGDDIVNLCDTFTWAIFTAQVNGFDIDFAEELGPCLFPHMYQRVHDYILHGKPKCVNDAQYEASVASLLRHLYEVVQYCKKHGTILQQFEELVTLAKSKQSLHGQGYIDWYLGRLKLVTDSREQLRGIIRKKKS
jgi:hypothetical protein